MAPSEEIGDERIRAEATRRREAILTGPTKPVSACDPDGIPDDLRAVARWVLWAWEPKDGGRWSKVPKSVDGRNAASDNPKTWCAFDAALAALRADPDRYAGLGFVLGGGWAGVDLDNCVVAGADGPRVTGWACALAGKLDSYTEVSPTGTGLKVLVKHDLLPALAAAGKRFSYTHESAEGEAEFIAANKFFTLTGHALPGFPWFVSDDAALDALVKEYPPGKVKAAPVATAPAAPARTSSFVAPEGMSAVERCRKYLRPVEASVQGQHGSNAVFKAARIIWHDFGLDFADGYPLLQEYNQRAVPPWPEDGPQGLRRKWEQAAQPRPGETKPRGYKLSENRPGYGGTNGKCAPIVGTSTANTKSAAAEARGRLNNVPDFAPFPLDALPVELRDLAAAGATAIGVDPSFIVLPGLSVLSAAVGSTHRVEVKPGWREPPYVSTLVVSPSGSKKTPAYKLACEDIAEDVNDDLEDEHAPEMATWEVEHANWQSRKDDPDRGARPKQPPLRRFAVSDVTLERLIGKLQENPRGLLVCRDELDAWLRSFTRYATHGSSDLPTWLSLFGAGTVNYSRKTGTHQEVRVRGVGVSVTGGIQPGVLREAMRPELMSAGLFARLALAMPPVPPRVWTDAEVSGRVVEDYKALVRRLFRFDFAERTDTGRTVPAVVPIDAEAKATFIDFYNRNGDAMALADANEAAARSKLEGYAVRLALVFNRCEPVPADEVKAEHMRAGVAVAEWFCYEIGRAQRLLTESNDVSALRDLARSVNRLAEKKGGRLTANWLHKANRGRFPTSATAETALESLVGAGLGKWDETPPGRGGQPTRFFTPLLTPLTPLPPLEDAE